MTEREGESTGRVGSYLGVGVYELPEAARLVGLPASRLRRWLTRDGREPLWRLQLPPLEGRIGLGFRDLVQVGVLTWLLRHGLPPRTLRRLLLKARELLRTEHPLASARFRTDGQRLYLEILEEEKLLDLDRDQYAFHRVVEPSLRPYDYDPEMAIRWWPLGRRRRVVVDPHRSFGQPVSAISGVPTAALFESHSVTGSYEETARTFEITEAEVEDAVAFERMIRSTVGASRLAA